MLGGIYEFLVDQRARCDDPGNPPVKQEASCACLVFWIDGKFLTNSHILVEVSDEGFEKTIELEEGEASHWNRSTIRLFGRKLEIEQWCQLLCLFEIELQYSILAWI